MLIFYFISLHTLSKNDFQFLGFGYFLSCSGTILSAITFPSFFTCAKASHWQTLLEQGVNQEKITESPVFIFQHRSARTLLQRPLSFECKIINKQSTEQNVIFTIFSEHIFSHWICMSIYTHKQEARGVCTHNIEIATGFCLRHFTSAEFLLMLPHVLFAF